MHTQIYTKPNTNLQINFEFMKTAITGVKWLIEKMIEMEKEITPQTRSNIYVQISNNTHHTHTHTHTQAHTQTQTDTEIEAPTHTNTAIDR